MEITTLLLLLLTLTGLAYVLGNKRSLALAGTSGRDLHSLPSYYGYFTAAWCLIPGLLTMALWLSFDDLVLKGMIVDRLPPAYADMTEQQQSLVLGDLLRMADGGVVAQQVDEDITLLAEEYRGLRQRSDNLLGLLALALGIAGGALALARIHPLLRARNQVERIVRYLLIASSSIAVLTTIGIFFSVIFEAARFFAKVPVSEFLFGLNWSPQTAIRADQVGSSGSFGAIPLFTGTLLISAIALIVAVPLGLMTAIYLSEYARPRFRAFVKPALEVLAGIPTVVYGFFAAITVGPFLRDLGDGIGLSIASESALAAGLVMGIMIIPFVSSLSDDVISAVPQAMRDGSFGLGATRSETIKRVVLPAALPGIVGGVLLAASRAIGETMIVVMAAGLAANLTANPFEAVTTVTVQIVTLLVGDQEFDSAKTLAAFALGLMLFVVTLILNVIALRVVRKYREQYE